MKITRNMLKKHFNMQGKAICESQFREYRRHKTVIIKKGEKIMTKNILKKYYEMQGKVILPEQKENSNMELAASVGANFASIGFPMTTEQMKHLAKADADDIVEFYKVNYEMLSEVVGAGKKLAPFYPDFPEGCMERSHAEYFLDQIIYGLSGLQLEPKVYMEEKKTFPFIGTPMHRILIEGSEEDLKATFDMAVKSAIAYSKEQREFIMEYAKENPDCVSVIAENVSTKNRENAVSCAMMLEELTGNSLHTASFMKQPADLLRYAAFKSVVKANEDRKGERDPYKSIALRDKEEEMPSFRIGRKDRTFIMDCLAAMDKGSGERLSNLMHGHDVEWNRLFKVIHITDRAWNKPKYDNVKRAIIIIQSGEKIDRPARRIEEAIKAGDVETAVKETAKMPGDFMRRFDKLYRMGIESGKPGLVLDTLKSASEKAGIATVTGTIGNIEQRDHDDEKRYFKGKNGKVVETTDKNRKAFTPAQIKDVVDAAMGGLSVRFAGKENMGKVYMADGVKDVKIPVDIRDNSGSIGSMTSGSKMPIAEDWKKMRFFVGWTNMNEKPEKREDHYYDNGRIDIDLTVAFCDKDMNIVGFCGWNGEYNNDGYVYSGDVQDGGPASGAGRGEFIDVDIDALRERGIMYMIPQINSFTGQMYSEQPNTCFGVMKRTSKDMGKVFEPAAVVNRFILDSECTQASPYVIDIVNREILWMNEQTMNNVASRGLSGILRRVGRIADSKGMPLSRLIEANVMANGEWTKNPQKADIIFVRDADEMEEVKNEFDLTGEYDMKFKLGNNMEYITGYLMQDGRREAKEK